jgi:hypothetical protein
MWLDTLLATGTVSDDQLQDARAVMEQRGFSLEKALVEWGYVTWEQIAALKVSESPDASRCPICGSPIDVASIVEVGHWGGDCHDSDSRVGGAIFQVVCTICEIRLEGWGRREATQRWEIAGLA